VRTGRTVIIPPVCVKLVNGVAVAYVCGTKASRPA